MMVPNAYISRALGQIRHFPGHFPEEEERKKSEVIA
jgi:hypothetical protein